MYRELELQETVTENDLISYGFSFNERKRKFELFKKLTDNIGAAFIAYLPEDENGKFINYKVTNLNTGNPYAPFYNRRYSSHNEIADRVEKQLEDEINKMIKTNLIRSYK